MLMLSKSSNIEFMWYDSANKVVNEVFSSHSFQGTKLISKDQWKEASFFFRFSSAVAL